MLVKRDFDFGTLKFYETVYLHVDIPLEIEELQEPNLENE